MRWNVNVYTRLVVAGGCAASLLASACASKTSTAPATPHGDEWLGPKDSKSMGPEHPLSVLMKTQPSSPRGELAGKHPRVFFGAEALENLKAKAKGSYKRQWQSILANLRALTTEPPAPPAQARRCQNVVGLGIAEAALAYLVEGDAKYLKAAKKWMDAAVSYDVWGYTYNKPNVDLAAGHLLFGLGWGYDLLYPHLTETERTVYRNKLAKQAQLLYEYYEIRPGRTFAYSQNHVYIPIAGLGVAAYALYGEVPAAESWASLSRAIMGRSLDTYSADGYFYESFEYWVFAVPWLVIWTSAHEHFTGEKLHDRAGFRDMHLYLAHILLPNKTHVFDFADAYTGPLTRSGKTDDFDRTHPGGKLHSNYNLVHATASWFGDEAAQGVAAAYEKAGHVTWYGFMSLLWFDDSVPAKPLSELQTYHHFPDHGVVFHRSSWDEDATAIAFKAGPPEGYATQDRIAQFPDWHLSSGHAHPDANSLIVYARGKYMTGDSGYSGVPRTDQHNTVLVNGRGQRFKMDGHNAFKGASYAQLSRISVEIKALGDDSFHLVGNAAAAYPSEIGLTEFRREVRLKRDAIEVVDTLESAGPATFTALWHSDEPIEVLDPTRFQLGGPPPRIDARVEADVLVETTTEPNWMTAPGRPGSVQKGKREARGFRTRVSNAKPSQRLVLKTMLEIHEEE